MAESDYALKLTAIEIDTDLSSLIAAARENPREFGVLYQRFVNPVFRYLYNRTGSINDAEDLTAQTFLAAFETFSRFRGDGTFAAWLFGIARNKVADHFRHRIMDLTIDDNVGETPQSDPLVAAIQADQSAVLAALIRSLDEDEQELLRLRFLAELTFPDMAKLLHRRQDAVKKALYRLLDRLQKRMEERNE